MFILTVHWDFRLLWEALTITAKIYVLCLIAASIHSTYSLARIAIRLRHLLKHMASIEARDLRIRLNEMAKGMETLRQFHTLLFLSFGACCANEMCAALRAISYSSMSFCPAGVEVFEPVVAWAFFVFVVLVFLHALQWAVAARLQSALGAGVNPI